jgi:hypothetical protein
LALAGLSLTGYETFMPRTRQRVGLRWRTLPLFAGYFFARIVDGRWRAIERSLGVHSVVKFSEASPAKCPDAEIAKLIARSDADGVVRLPTPRSQRLPRRSLPGARVVITGGALRGFEAIHTGMTSNERELVLLNVLGAPRQVEIASGLLRAQ